ncbi:hypothetical protein [Spirillospora sp. NPDC047279]|uniref:hypothetical protein n=1 Tax=Spirillospora sp. NPDC047279 TaxID=3155478 RepID=UPI0033F7A0F4
MLVRDRAIRPLPRLAVPLVLPLTLPALLLGTAAACGDSSSAKDTAATPALTKAEAAKVIDAYGAAANKAAATLDAKALAAVETGPQLAMDTAQFKLRKAIGQRTATVAKFTKPAFYIPRMDGHPRWFAADVTTETGKDSLRHALLFTQAKPGGPWLLAADPYLSEAAFAKVALDKEGYATPVRPDDNAPALQPAKVPDAHAALLTGGPQAPGAAGLAAGPTTTQAYDALRQAQRQLKPGGVTLTSSFTAEPGPVRALRTTDGGALVWYVVRQNEAYSSRKKGKLAVTGDLVGLAPPASARKRLDTTVLVQYLAAVPREGQTTVTGMYRKAVQAAGS